MTTPSPHLPFATQRLVFFGLLFGMTMFALAAAVLIMTNDGKGMASSPLPQLQSVVVPIGIAAAIGALVMRRTLLRTLPQAPGRERSQARFRATLVPLVLLEAGCLFALTSWFLNGDTVPNLVVALVLLSLAIAIVPLSDPDAESS